MEPRHRTLLPRQQRSDWRWAWNLSTVTLVACGLIAWPAIGSAQVIADGPEVRINRGTDRGIGFPDVAHRIGTEFVVVWTGTPENPPDYGSSGSILARRALPNGPIGDEFVVNALTEYDYSSEAYPVVSVNDDASFVVVWENYYEDDGSESGIFAQRFDGSADKRGSVFGVNVFTTGRQTSPRLGGLPGGSFVVVWDDRACPSCPARRGVYARIFDSDGSALSGDIQVASYTTGDPFNADVAVAPDGSFVVVWRSKFLDASGSSVVARYLSADGGTLTPEWVVNTYTTGNQAAPRIASLDSDGFIVVWRSSSQDGDLSGIFGQRLDGAGAPIGPELALNAYTTGQQSVPAVAAVPDGHFAVVWLDYARDGDGLGVFGNVFDLDGTPVGIEFQVNTYTTGKQGRRGEHPAISADDNGNFVVIFEGVKHGYPMTGGTHNDTFARHFITKPLCGDPDGSQDLTTTDALRVLKTGVGATTCDPCLCDVDGGGTVNATDALLVLKVAVNQPQSLSCPSCT